MVKTYQLKNNTKVIYKHVPLASSISCYGYFPYGVATEARGNEGITHLIEHLLFSGTEKNPTHLDISMNFERNGINFEAITFRDMMTAGIQSTTNLDSFREGFDLLIQSLFCSKISKKNFQTEKKVIEEEINYYTSESEFNIWGEVSHATWGEEHSLGKKVEGFVQSVRNLDFEEAQKYYRNHFTPENLVLCITGNINSDLLDEILSNYEKQYPAVNNHGNNLVFNTSKDWNSKRVNKLAQGNSEMVWVGMGFPFQSDKLDRVMVELAEIYLTEGDSAFLQLHLREESGLLYNITSNSNTSRNGGEFALSFASNKNKTDYIAHKIQDLIHDFVNISDEMFYISKNRYISNLVFGLESTKDYSRFLGRNYMVHGEIDSLETMVEKIKSLQKDDFVRFLKNTFSSKNMSIVLMN